MKKSDFALLIDAYADAKVSGNKILIKSMISELEIALNELFGSDNGPEEAEFEPVDGDE